VITLYVGGQFGATPALTHVVLMGAVFRKTGTIQLIVMRAGYLIRFLDGALLILALTPLCQLRGAITVGVVGEGGRMILIKIAARMWPERPREIDSVYVTNKDARGTKGISRDSIDSQFGSRRIRLENGVNSGFLELATRNLSFFKELSSFLSASALRPASRDFGLRRT